MNPIITRNMIKLEANWRLRHRYGYRRRKSSFFVVIVDNQLLIFVAPLKPFHGQMVESMVNTKNCLCASGTCQLLQPQSVVYISYQKEVLFLFQASAVTLCEMESSGDVGDTDKMTPRSREDGFQFLLPKSAVSVLDSAVGFKLRLKTACDGNMDLIVQDACCWCYKLRLRWVLYGDLKWAVDSEEMDSL